MWYRIPRRSWLTMGETCQQKFFLYSFHKLLMDPAFLKRRWIIHHHIQQIKRIFQITATEELVLWFQLLRYILIFDNRPFVFHSYVFRDFPSNCNAVEFRYRFCLLKVTQLLSPRKSNFLSLSFSRLRIIIRDFQCNITLYRVHIVLNGAAGPLQDRLLQLAAVGTFKEHIWVLVTAECPWNHVAKFVIV